MISENIKEIEKRIESAAIESGRTRKDIKLIAVTKTVPTQIIREAINCGITDIGENYAQEFRDKQDSLKNVKMHFIGHLQTNKVKYVVGKTELIQSVDSIKIANEINKQSEKLGIISDVLIELNTENEVNKTGMPIDFVCDLLKNISEMNNIKVKGLMTIGPNYTNKKDSIYIFKKMFDLFIDIREKKIDNIYMEILSMGMTGDFEDAIREGSNMVRVGTGIFGKRN